VLNSNVVYLWKWFESIETGLFAPREELFTLLGRAKRVCSPKVTRPLVQHPYALADCEPDARPTLDRALEHAARLVEVVAGVEHELYSQPVPTPLLDLVEIASVGKQRILVGPVVHCLSLRAATPSTILGVLQVIASAFLACDRTTSGCRGIGDAARLGALRTQMERARDARARKGQVCRTAPTADASEWVTISRHCGTHSAISTLRLRISPRSRSSRLTRGIDLRPDP
jgi:hypothetical protein